MPSKQLHMPTKEQLFALTSKLPIEEIALKTGFVKHRDTRITGVPFVLSFFQMIGSGLTSLSDWAAKLSFITGGTVSESAVRAKLYAPQEDFFYALLGEALSRQVASGFRGSTAKLFGSFNRVLVEDSTCINLPGVLAGLFRGSHSNYNSKVSTLKIQFRMDLLTNVLEKFAIRDFRHNDQSFSADILNGLQKADLIIRDLGYWSLSVFGAIMKMDAFFLSRLRYGVILYEKGGEKRIDLHEMMKKADKNGITVIEKDVLVGEGDRLPMRLVAIKNPENIAQQRRRKAVKDRGAKASHSKEYMACLGWTFFITNVEKTVWTAAEILLVYGFRWRIEVVFKCWKSFFNMKEFFRKQKLSASRVIITILLMLVYASFFFARFYSYYLERIFEKTGKFVSILKFAKCFAEYFLDFVTNENQSFLEEFVARLCVYKKRTIPNYCEKLYMLNFTVR